MTLDQAIRDLQARIDGEFSIMSVDKCEDIKLGLEAVKRVKHVRETYQKTSYVMLPGETEE